jgi:uncharacterized protein with NAD-binding domain and iron-sulfur cluster
MAAITAAYHLSGSSTIMNKYDIEVYQQGWRLGGKGASGRAEDRNRILEHGLHVWFGYYENSFRLLRDCHDELNRLADRGVPRWSTTMQSIEQAFRPISTIGIVESEAPGWRPWIATFPEDDSSPWDRDLDTEQPRWNVNWCLTTLMTRSAALIAALVRSAADEKDLTVTSIDPIDAPGGLEELLVGLGQRVSAEAGLAEEPAEILAALASRAIEVIAGGGDGELYDITHDVMAAAGRMLDAIRLRLDDQLTERPAVRRLWALTDVLTAILRGLLYHRVSREEDFDLLDQFEFREWLQLHGALAESVNSSLIRTVAYDLPFAYEEGNPDLSACGAGTALRTLFRAFFTYRGAIMWKMNAGMGDVVFAPLYELLVKRGVTFKFFNQVTDIHVVGARVTEFKVRHQRIGADGRPADRLTPVEVAPGGGMPAGTLMCWPAQPGDASEIDAERMESWWDPAEGEEDTIKLTNPADKVLFAMPVSMIPYVGRQLTSQTKWQDLVDHVKTTATQALQIWSTRTAEELGWYADAVVGGYDAPYDTFSDMPELRFQEGASNAVTVLYLCAVLPDAPEGAAPDTEKIPADDVRARAEAARTWVFERRATVRALAEGFFSRRAVGLWPGAMDPATGGFDERLKSGMHYVRGNFQPSDRYVLSVPGSVQYRLDPANTGFDNLFAAGDWTRCVINAGCVEAATISGMLAAEAIFGREEIEFSVPIIGRAAERNER